MKKNLSYQLRKGKEFLFAVTLVCVLFALGCARLAKELQSSNDPLIAIPSQVSVKLHSGETLDGSLNAIEPSRQELTITIGALEKEISFDEVKIVLFEEESTSPTSDGPVLRGSESWEVSPADAFQIKTLEPLVASVDHIAVTPKGSSSFSARSGQRYILNSITFDPNYPILNLVLSSE